MARREAAPPRRGPVEPGSAATRVGDYQKLYGGGKRHETQSVSDSDTDGNRELSEDLRPRKPIKRDRADLSQLREPPMHIEAEQMVLGGLMQHPDLYWTMLLKLKPDDFYSRLHQDIYRAIGEVSKESEQGVLIDALTVGEWFLSRGRREEIQGGAYLVELAGTVGSAANIDAWAELIVERAKRRRLIVAGTTMVNKAFDPNGDTADEIMAASVAEIEQVETRVSAQGTPFKVTLRETMANITAAFQSETQDLPGMRFGMPKLEDLIGGLEAGKVYAIGANTKIGKSVLMMNIADGAAELGYKIGEWHLEMNKKQVGMRRMSAVSGVHHDTLRRPKLLEEHHWPAMAQAAQQMLKWTITGYYDQAAVEQIAAQATMLKARGMLDLIVVDYLQKIVANKGMDRRDLEIGHSTWGLKSLAKRLDVPVLTAFQLNRKNQDGAVVRAPRPSDARESGNIEQDVDVMILLHRPGVHDTRQRGSGLRCEVALNRDGDTGIVRFDERLECLKFVESEYEWVDGDSKASYGGNSGLD